MIVSHRYKFIYFKAVKVAGTSAEAALAEHCGPNDIISKIDSNTWQHKPRNFKVDDKVLFYNHMSPELIKSRIDKKVWQTYKKTAVVRNPWDCMVSRYWWFHKGGALKKNREPLSFSEWLKNGKYNKYENTQYYFDTEGNPICDYYMKFEQLNSTIKQFCKMIKMPLPTEIPFTKHNLRDDQGMTISDYYTDEDILIVAKQACRDIEFFGYEPPREI